MLNALVTIKAILKEAELLSRKHSDVANGLAVSLYQDAVELYLWSLVKALGVNVKEKAGFVDYMTALQEKGHEIKYRNGLMELNTARVSFKHYGNLPAESDVVKFGILTSEFFDDSCYADFSVKFSDVSITSLVKDVEIRGNLEASERSLAKDELQEAAEHLGVAHYLMLRSLQNTIPRFRTGKFYPGAGLSADASNARVGFEAVGESLEAIRNLLVLAASHIDPQQYELATKHLPTTHRVVSGKFFQNHNIANYSKHSLADIYSYIIDVCIRINL
jgi:hypothetical protein